MKLFLATLLSLLFVGTASAQVGRPGGVASQNPPVNCPFVGTNSLGLYVCTPSPVPGVTGSLFGEALNAPNDWVDQELLQGSTYLLSSVFSINPVGAYALMGASRTSDHPCSGFPDGPLVCDSGFAAGAFLEVRNDFSLFSPLVSGAHPNAWGLYVQTEHIGTRVGQSFGAELSSFHGTGGSIRSFSGTIRGSGYTPTVGALSYTCVDVSNISHSSLLGGQGATATVTVSNGSVISITICDRGTGYNVGDVVTVDPSMIGGTGSGFTTTIASKVYGDPYLINLFGSSNTLRIDCGKGSDLNTLYPPADPSTNYPSQTCFMAMVVGGNPASYDSGIVFDHSAMSHDIYTNPPAISLPGNTNGYAITWFAGADAPGWSIFSTVNTGAQHRSLQFGNSLVRFVDGNGNTNFSLINDVGGQVTIGSNVGKSAGNYLLLSGGATGTGKVVLTSVLPITGPIATLGAITPGSGYTDGVYTNIPLIFSSGTNGSGAIADITVAGGVVTVVTVTTTGGAYDATSVLTAATNPGTCSTCIGTTGSGFSVPVATVTIDAGADLVFGTAGTGRARFSPTTDGTSSFIVTTSAASSNLSVLNIDTTNKIVQASRALMVGSTTNLTLSPGEVGLAKIIASGTAPGAAGLKLSVVCGTNAGTAKIVASAGTSGTTVDVKDNIGAGVTGC